MMTEVYNPLLPGFLDFELSALLSYSRLEPKAKRKSSSLAYQAKTTRREWREARGKRKHHIFLIFLLLCTDQPTNHQPIIRVRS
jgi:hypothetical protein